MWGLLWIIYKTGENFFFWSCIFITVFVFLLVVLAPLVIMPLFNKFAPLEENILKKDIESLATEIKFPLTKVEVIDGSTRSSHSNAFFYGFGKFKKIVLFDTLLKHHLGLKEGVASLDKDKESEKGNTTTINDDGDTSEEELNRTLDKTS